MKYFKGSEVLRIENNKLKIIWNIEEDVEVSVFSLIDNVEKIIGKIKGKNEFVTEDFYKNKRCLFILKAENYHYEIVAERLIPLEGVHHFRDIGGYRSEDGRRVKWNMFYRADKLSGLTDNDIRYIKNMGIRTILDLRSKVEIKVSPDPKIKGIKYINLSAMKELEGNSGNLDMVSLFNSGVLDNIDVESFMLNAYRNMVSNNLALKKLIECIENEESLPIIFHCSTGKDRTGLSSVIILSILGVSKKVIKEDYMASNFYRRSINDAIVKKFKEKIKSEDKLNFLKFMLEVKEELVDAFFEEINNKYGGMDNYLEKEYNLTRKKKKEIKNRLLY